MHVLVISIILLGLFAAVAGWFRYRKLRAQIRKGELDKIPEIHQVTDCGADECSLETTGSCDQVCSRLKPKVHFEYFDDEELDRFKGKDGGSYSDEEIEEFREVLYTMKPEEVEDWTDSLSAREVALPNALKDEVFLIMNERRQ